jgi:hypothetical protein
MTRPPRFLLVVLLASATIGAAVEIAIADVDPASDVLLLQDEFVPYSPAVCTQLKDQLRSLTKKSKAAGYPLKVALIGSDNDLGGAPQFFGKPNPYAKFLGQELGIYGANVERNYKNVHLLVVMPKGFGVYQIEPKAASVLRDVSIPSNADSNGLAKAAIEAVPKVATAAGHPVASVKPASGCTKKGTNVLVFIAPVIALLIGGVLLRYGLRPRKPAEAAPDGGEAA